jgi:hypothetical protein
MATKTDKTIAAPAMSQAGQDARYKAANAPTKAVPKAKAKAKAKSAPKTAPKRATIAPETIAALIALLKTKKGATNDEAATALKIKSKGDAPHQSPSAQVRALIRDKVRPSHKIIAEHDGERGGVVFRIK